MSQRCKAFWDRQEQPEALQPGSFPSKVTVAFNTLVSPWYFASERPCICIGDPSFEPDYTRMLRVGKQNV